MFDFSPKSSWQGAIPFFFAGLVFIFVLTLPTTSGLKDLHAESKESARLGFVGPAFAKFFSPTTIGPGSSSTLTFQITNSSSSPVTDLAFTDTMPAGMTVSAPLNVSNECAGTVTATAGSGTITLADGNVAASTSCSISVDVTSSTPGAHLNTSDPLASSEEPVGDVASATLTVATDRPGFSKSFSPSTIDFGGRSTLTFTIDNSANGAAVNSLSFTDDFPVGMVVADPANASTTCGTLVPATVTAVPGSDSVSMFVNPFGMDAGTTCTVTVDVIATAIGELINSSDSLFAFSGDAGKANAGLIVEQNNLYLTNEFVNDPAAVGGTVDLQFTIENRDRLESATNIAFTNDLDATLSGLVALGTPQSNVCGSGTLSGTSLLSLTGASLAPSESCVFTATLQIPVSTPVGVYPNMTSDVTATVDGSPVVGSAGSDSLFISSISFSKTFVDDPVAAGEDVTLRYTIANNSTVSAATDITFNDEMTTFLPFPLVITLPSTPCGAGSTVILSSPGSERQSITLSGGDLAVSDSCTFDVILTIPAGFASGAYYSESERLTATISAQSVESQTAVDVLEVVSAPEFSKSFVDDPVLGGETVTLEYTITHGVEEPSPANSIGFTDDLDAVLSGLVATGLPQNDVCGTGSTISGTSLLTLSGGNLQPGETCTISIELQLPSLDILPGELPSVSSNLSATVSGLVVQGLTADDNLIIGGLTFSHSFIDSPVIPGDTVTAEFVIENESPAFPVSGMFFTSDFDNEISGLTIESLAPAEPCGMGSSLNDLGGATVALVGGNLATTSSCTFSVTLRIPTNATIGSYSNNTSSLSATMNATPLSLNNSLATFSVDDFFIELSKSYLEESVLPGEIATLRFTIENLHSVDVASSITFTDDLDASLSGLIALPPLPSEPCGTGSQLVGTSELVFSNGVISAMGSCSFDVTVQVPETVAAGESYENVTTEATAVIDSFDVTGSSATDLLTIGAAPIFFPLLMSDVLLAPDLIVTNLTATSNGISFEIENQGTTAVADPFWIDVYIDPTTAPSAVNQIWEQLGSYGAVWFVDEVNLPFEVGDTMIFTINDANFEPDISNVPDEIAVGTAIYIQVDSANANTDYGGVLETHEITDETYNNIFGPVFSVSQ
ncbi:MAG: hypothetical protein AAF490_08800 [Chloroflexota bacterium]